jgi:hypothetical protein
VWKGRVEEKGEGRRDLQPWYLPDMMIFEWYTARLSFLEILFVMGIKGGFRAILRHQ